MSSDWKRSSTDSILAEPEKMRSGDPTRHSYYSIPCHHAAALCAGAGTAAASSPTKDNHSILWRSMPGSDFKRTISRLMESEHFVKKIMFSFFFLWKTKIQSPGLGSSSTKPLRAITLHGLTMFTCWICLCLYIWRRQQLVVYYVEYEFSASVRLCVCHQNMSHLHLAFPLKF